MKSMRLIVGATMLPAATVQAAGDAGGGSSLFTGDIGNILWTMITFVAVLVVLGKFAWGPILGALKNREEFIRDSLEQAKSDREEAEARLKEYIEKIETAKSEASAIVQEARRDAEVLKRKLEDTGKEEAAAMLERAKREIEVAKDTAVKDLYTLGARMATSVASRLISEEIDAAKHERLIAESIKEVQSANRN